MYIYIGAQSGYHRLYPCAKATNAASPRYYLAIVSISVFLERLII